LVGNPIKLMESAVAMYDLRRLVLGLGSPSDEDGTAYELPCFEFRLCPHPIIAGYILTPSTLTRGPVMPDNKFAHRDTSGSEYYRERSGGDERLIKKEGSILPVIGAVVATALAFLVGSR